MSLPIPWPGFLDTDDKRREWALWTIGICLPLMMVLCTFENGSKVGRVIFTATALILGAISYAKGWLNRQAIKPLLPPLIAVFIGILIACTFSIDPGYSFKMFFEQHLWFGLLLLLVAGWADTPGRQRTLLRGYLLAAAVSAIAGVFLYYFAHDLDDMHWIKNWDDYVYRARDESGNYYFRAQGLLESYTRSAMVFVMAVPAAFAICLDAMRKRRFWEVALCVVVLLFSLWYLLLTKSRGPWLAVGTSTFLTFIFLRGRLLYLFAAMGVALALLVVMPKERQRALTLIQHISNPDLLFSGRFELWKQGQQPISENLWTGIGHGGNIFLTDAGIERYELYSANDRQPDLHQIYMQTLAEVGIIGFAAYAWLVITLLVLGFRSLKRHWNDPELPGGPVALASLISMLIFGLVFYYNEEHVAQLLYTMVGLLAARPDLAALESQSAGE